MAPIVTKVPLAPIDRALTTLESGLVSRYHAAPSVPPQSVAAHSWGVAMLLVHIVGDPKLLSKELLLEALAHDTGEIFTGDIPFSFKRARPELREILHEEETKAREIYTLVTAQTLTEREQALLKIADTLEGLIWTRTQERGNFICNRWHGALSAAREKFERLVNEEEWERIDQLVTRCWNSLAASVSVS